MNWIEKIRAKPPEQRIRVIWICVIVAAVLLIILWIVTWGYKKTAPKDTSVLDTIFRGAKNFNTNFKVPQK